MNEKRNLNEIKNDVRLNQLFSKMHNYFSTKSTRTYIHFRQRCTWLWNPYLKIVLFWKHFLTRHFILPTVLLYSHQQTVHNKPFPHCTLHLTHRLTVLTSTNCSQQTISSLHTSPYPPSYCTHINTLINTNHFLPAHFTLPTVLLYSHQHTHRHKPFPPCTLHLTHRLTVLTSTHSSPQTISSLHTSPNPPSYCTHINTLITTNHFLPAHFTLPTVLLYSHQHTHHHKPFPHYTLHLTHRLTVLTSTHWSPQTIS